MTSYFNKWDKYDIIEENGVITYVSDFFCRLTEYNAQDLIGMTAEKLLYETLRAVMRTAGLDDGTEAILFTKDLTAINVIIQRTICEETTRIQFVVIEIPLSRFDDRYPYIHQLSRSTAIGVAVYSVPDMILIKANEKYFSFLNPPFHLKTNSIGMKIDMIAADWSGSPAEQYWQEAVNTHKAVQVQEYEYTGCSTVLTYWDSILAPIEENGVVKYIVSNTLNVTERVTSRKQIEENNKLIGIQKRQLEAIIDNCSDGMYLFDKDGNYIYQNKTATDYTDGKLYPSVFDFIKDCQYSDINGKKIPCSSIPAVQVLNGIKVNNQVVTKMTPFGKAYYDVCGTPILDESGNVCCGVIYIRDMTNYILQSETIQKQNEELEVIIDNMSDGLAVIDKYGKYIRFNKKVREYTKNATSLDNFAEYIGESMEKGQVYYDIDGNILSPDDFPSAKLLRGEKIKDMKVIAKHNDNTYYFEFNANSILDENGNLRLGIILNRDVTEQIISERIIKEQKALLEVIVSSLQEAIDVYDKNNQYLVMKFNEVNLDSKDMQNLNQSRKYYHLDGSEVKAEETAKYRAMHGETTVNQIIYCNENGRKQYCLVNGKPITDKEGNHTYGIISTLDITDLMNSQFELREAKEKLLKLEYEKNEVLINAIKQKDEFLYLITHEFKTPLTVIISALQTMDMVCRNQIPDKAGKYLNKIKQNVYRQMRLVGNLLDVTRLNSGFTSLNSNVYDIVHITRSIVESIRSIAQQKEIQVNFLTQLSKHEILVDEQKFERILLNLLSNALKFTRKSKFINVTLDQIVYHNEKMIAVSVQDSGIGIPKEKQKFIFERFGQVNTNLSRQAEGTGIGLYLVKLMVNAMGGYITLDSEEGEGSTFTVMLPDIKSKEMTDSSKGEEEQLIKRDERLTSEIEIQLSDIYD